MGRLKSDIGRKLWRGSGREQPRAQANLLESPRRGLEHASAMFAREEDGMS